MLPWVEKTGSSAWSNPGSTQNCRADDDDDVDFPLPDNTLYDTSYMKLLTNCFIAFVVS
jgi:hypothetical protein